MSTVRDLSCADFPRAACCTSCHEDAESWGFPLVEYALPEGRMAHVCCSVAATLDAESERKEAGK